jgi:hypothetical protein
VELGEYEAMKINEITLNENLNEGPLLNKIGTGIGNTIGAAAKGVGALAGGVAGLGAAAKKGFQAGKATVSQGGDQPADTTAPAGNKTASTTASAGPTTAPAQVQGTSTAGPNAADIQAQIAQKQAEIQDLQTQLSQATAATKSSSKTTKTTTTQEPKDGENAIAQGINGVQQAWEKGARPLGGAWGSVADTGKPEKQGIEGYTKTTDGQWIEKATNQPVTDPKLIKVLGQQDKANAQSAQAPAEPEKATPTQAQQPAQGFKDSTGGKFNMDTGKPFASQAEADAQSARLEQDKEWGTEADRENVRATGIKGHAGSAFDQMTGKPFASQADADAHDDKLVAARAAKQAGADDMGRIEPTMEPAQAAAPAAPAAKPAAPSYSNQLAGGNQNITTGGTFNPTTMQNVPGKPVQAAVPNTRIPQPMNAVGPATQPATAAPAAAPAKALDPRDLNKDGTVDATEKSIARNKAKKPAPVMSSKINQSRGIDLAEALWRKMKQ